MSGKVLVTGANGFVGSRLVDALRHRGIPMRALVRSVPRASLSDVEVVQCDLTRDTEVIAAAVEGCDVVFHCAGAVGDHVTWENGKAVNVEAVRSIAQAARHARARPRAAPPSLRLPHPVVLGAANGIGCDAQHRIANPSGATPQLGRDVLIPRASTTPVRKADHPRGVRFDVSRSRGAEQGSFADAIDFVEQRSQLVASHVNPIMRVCTGSEQARVRALCAQGSP